VIILVAGALGVMYYRRRQRRPDHSAAVVFEQEARSVGDQKTFVGGGAARSINISAAATDSPHLHEFFPPVIGTSSHSSESSA
jgi:hypothetical protein